VPRGQTNKLYRTFVKGLITEAGFLTYPEDASTDELNTVLHRKGNRSRRLGMDFEPDSTASVITDYTEDDTTNEYFWKAVANKADTNFLVVQVGDKLHFYDASSSPLSEGKKSFTVDLQAYKAPTATASDVRGHTVQMTAGKGYLFAAQEFIDPIVIEYDADTDTISTVKIVIQVRDFDGVNDGLANDQEPTTLSAEHHYNLKNQGWVQPGTPAVQGSDGTGGDPVHVYYDPYTGDTREYRRALDGPMEN